MVLVGMLAETSRPQCAIDQLTSPTPIGGDVFGRSLSLDGTELVVGSRYSATVFVRQSKGTPLDATDDEWVAQTHLFTQDPNFADSFGLAVSLDDDHLIVGTPTSGSFNGPGAAYIYRRVDTGHNGNPADDTWNQQSLLLPEGGGLAAFGLAVAVQGDLAVVAAPQQGMSGKPQTGLAHVYRRQDGGTPDDPADDVWSKQSVLSATDGAFNDNFGVSLDVCGADLLIGAHLAAPSGAVYHFRFNDGGTPLDASDDSWVQHSKLTPPAADAVKLFGIDVDVDSDHVAVGANGRAYMFILDDLGTPTDPADAQWVLEESLSAPDGDPLDEFGTAVALDGDRALIGAPKYGAFTEGSAFVFDHPAGTRRWNLAAKLSPPELGGGIQFGATTSLGGDQAFVSERGFFFGLSAADSSVGGVATYALVTEPWSFIDAALATPEATTCLLCTGSLVPGSTVALALDNAPASTLVAIVIGLSDLAAPFKGGVLIPQPDLIAWSTTDSGGHANVNGRVPLSVPSGLSLYLQAWFTASGGPQGFAATNATKGTIP